MGSRVWDDPGSRSQDTLHDVIYRCGNVRVLGCGMHWSTIGLPGDPQVRRLPLRQLLLSVT